jgi:hypothetical protein
MITNRAAKTLGEFNVGLAAALGFLNPLGAQLDALIGLGIGPLSFDLNARLNALLAAQANIGLQLAMDPRARLTAILTAIASLQAALAGALSLDLGIRLTVEVGLLGAITGAISVQLGGLQLAIQAALAIKIPAMRAAARLAAHMSAGPAFLIAANGSMNAVGADLAAELGQSSLTYDGNTIQGFDSVIAILLFAKEPSVQVALQAIIKAG